MVKPTPAIGQGAPSRLYIFIELVKITHGHEDLGQCLTGEPCHARRHQHLAAFEGLANASFRSRIAVVWSSSVASLSEPVGVSFMLWG